MGLCLEFVCFVGTQCEQEAMRPGMMLNADEDHLVLVTFSCEYSTRSWRNDASAILFIGIHKRENAKDSVKPREPKLNYPKRAPRKYSIKESTLRLSPIEILGLTMRGNLVLLFRRIF